MLGGVNDSGYPNMTTCTKHTWFRVTASESGRNFDTGTIISQLCVQGRQCGDTKLRLWELYSLLEVRKYLERYTAQSK